MAYSEAINTLVENAGLTVVVICLAFTGLSIAHALIKSKLGKYDQ